MYRMIFALMALAWSGAAWSGPLAEAPCDGAQPGIACACDVRALRPLQGAVGMEEVAAKTSEISANPKRARKDVTADPVKVVAGPGGAFYITDHHHGAAAWLRALGGDTVCQIVSRPAWTTADGFWSGLEQDRLVRLADREGRPLRPADLPATLDAMGDDPYRSLAWRVRKARGFCRPPEGKEFVEFVWADWFRSRLPIPQGPVRSPTEAVLPAALRLAHSPEASGLPGYVAKAPVKCPKS